MKPKLTLIFIATLLVTFSSASSAGTFCSNKKPPSDEVPADGESLFEIMLKKIGMAP